MGYRKTIQHALQLSSKHQCDCSVNLSKAEMAEPNSSNQQVGADWGLRTLRQACFQENPESAMCVQNFDDSRGLAIRITYRISLRSSSLWEPRHPLLKVVINCLLGPATARAADTHRLQILVSFLVTNGACCLHLRDNTRWGYQHWPPLRNRVEGHNYRGGMILDQVW